MGHDLQGICKAVRYIAYAYANTLSCRHMFGYGVVIRSSYLEDYKMKSSMSVSMAL
jgi:hypothetical protein